MNIQELADSLKPFAPIIQWVSGKWHVTFADYDNIVCTGDSILTTLQVARVYINRRWAIQGEEPPELFEDGV